MTQKTAREPGPKEAEAATAGLASYLPDELRRLDYGQTDIPRISKDSKLIALIEAAIQQVPHTSPAFTGGCPHDGGAEAGERASGSNLSPLLDTQGV
jgi:hypothetical protein